MAAETTVNCRNDAPKRSAILRELAHVFLKLGATSFGGPAVHIALLEHEAVHRRKWLTHKEFLDLLGATNLIPGPNSTEMAIHIGLKRAGWPGLLVAGSCFIVPAVLITLGCAWFYIRYAQVPQLQGVLYGIKPVVLAIVVQAIWRLGHASLRKPVSVAVAVVAVAASVAGLHELLVLLIAGIVVPTLRGAWSSVRRTPSQPLSIILMPWLPLSVAAGPVASAPSAVGLLPLFGFFLKVGSVLYGSGYVLLAFLQADLVERWHWLTQDQLLDAISIGQVTPGPLFTTATFIGYVLGGGPGACVATLGIFLPPFVFVAASAPLIPRLRQSKAASAFLDGVNAASLALMAVATLHMASGAFVDMMTVALGGASAAALLIFRVNPIWLILTAGAVGFALH